jgi:hypothetical protein
MRQFASSAMSRTNPFPPRYGRGNELPLDQKPKASTVANHVAAANDINESDVSDFKGNDG